MTYKPDSLTIARKPDALGGWVVKESLNGKLTGKLVFKQPKGRDYYQVGDLVATNKWTISQIKANCKNFLPDLFSDSEFYRMLFGPKSFLRDLLIGKLPVGYVIIAIIPYDEEQETGDGTVVLQLALVLDKDLPPLICEETKTPRIKELFSGYFSSWYDSGEPVKIAGEILSILATGVYRGLSSAAVAVLRKKFQEEARKGLSKKFFQYFLIDKLLESLKKNGPKATLAFIKSFAKEVAKRFIRKRFKQELRAKLKSLSTDKKDLKLKEDPIWGPAFIAGITAAVLSLLGILEKITSDKIDEFLKKDSASSRLVQYIVKRIIDRFSFGVLKDLIKIFNKAAISYLESKDEKKNFGDFVAAQAGKVIDSFLQNELKRVLSAGAKEIQKGQAGRKVNLATE